MNNDNNDQSPFDEPFVPKNTTNNDEYDDLKVKNNITIQIHKEVLIIFNLNNLLRFYLTIDESFDFKTLCKEITTKFISNYKEFKNLEGLGLCCLLLKKDKISLATPLSYLNYNFNDLYKDSTILI